MLVCFRCILSPLTDSLSFLESATSINALDMFKQFMCTLFCIWNFNYSYLPGCAQAIGGWWLSQALMCFVVITWNSRSCSKLLMTYRNLLQTETTELMRCQWNGKEEELYLQAKHLPNLSSFDTLGHASSSKMSSVPSWMMKCLGNNYLPFIRDLW